MINIIEAWFICSIITLLLVSMNLTEKHRGFRTRFIIAVLWFLWTPILLLGVLVAFVYALIKNTSILECMESIFKKQPFKFCYELV